MFCKKCYLTPIREFKASNRCWACAKICFKCGSYGHRDHRGRTILWESKQWSYTWVILALHKKMWHIFFFLTHQYFPTCITKVGLGKNVQFEYYKILYYFMQKSKYGLLRLIICSYSKYIIYVSYLMGNFSNIKYLQIRNLYNIIQWRWK